MGQNLKPQSEEEISHAVKTASGNKQSLRIRAGGSRSEVGNHVETGQVLDTSGNEGVVVYEPGSLHMVVRAGTKMSEIEKLLARENQMLAFEPMDHRALLGTKGKPTVGGMVAGNVSGPRRFLAGACRDHVLGVRFVNGKGEAIKSGGRVMKNVTGLDLVKLQCGAYGTLGVLSEVSLKTLPKPEAGLTLALPELSAEKAVETFSTALRSPYEVSGAAWVDGIAYLRLEGFEIQVNERSEKLAAQFSGAEFEKITGVSHQKLWHSIRDVEHFADVAGAVWRISVKPGDAPAVTSELQDKFGCEVSLDWGGGLIWLLVPEEHSDPADEIRATVNQKGGHVTLVRGAEASRQAGKAFHPEPRRLAELSRQLRQQFDPHGLFNPGLMVQER